MDEPFLYNHINDKTCYKYPNYTSTNNQILGNIQKI